MPVALSLIASFFSLSLGYSQELPKEISLKPKEDRYCTAALRDLKGVEFQGAVRVHRPDDGDSLYFYVVEQHPTYKAHDAKDTYDYGVPRAVIVVTGPRMGDSAGDTMRVDNDSFFGSSDQEKNEIKGEKMRLFNSVAACAAKATSQ